MAPHLEEAGSEAATGLRWPNHLDSTFETAKSFLFNSEGVYQMMLLLPAIFARPAACNRACLCSLNGGAASPGHAARLGSVRLVLALLRGAAAVHKKQCTGATGGGLPWRVRAPALQCARF